MTEPSVTCLTDLGISAMMKTRLNHQASSFPELELFTHALSARLLKDTVGLFIQFSTLPIAGNSTLLIIGRNGGQ